jgi:hypothetical protein
MAKRGTEPPGSGDKAKVRVFFAEVEGNNESVQDALKTMVSAMSRPVRVVSDQKSNGKTAQLLENIGSEETEIVDDEAGLGEQNEEEFETQSARRVRGTGKKIDRNAGLELVPNLDFRPSDKPDLRAFVDEKDPKNDVEVVIVVLHYMQHTMALTKIGPAHVMTAFKEVGKSIPVDLKQTIRNIKKSKMWLNFTDIEDLRTTTQGDNFVEHDLGKSK